MKFNPKDPNWINRDRFVLSNGHACALLYSLLVLYKFELTVDDLKQFRQLGSKTPGHPEATDTAGVEVTTGPLGQGISNAVGIAIAQNNLPPPTTSQISPFLTLMFTLLLVMVV